MIKRTLIALAASTALVGVAQAQMFDFAAYDADRDGSITTTEYRDGLARDGYFVRLDANRDGMIGADEYGDEAAFAQYDRNTDGMLDENEYYDGLTASYDANQDGIFDEDEFGTFADAGNQILGGAGDIVTGTVRAGGAVVEGVVGGAASLLGFDTDNDQRLTAAEFNAALDGTGYFDRFDTDRDGFLAENEFNDRSRAFVAEYDGDADGRLSRNEYYGALYGSYDADRDGFLNDAEYGRFQTERM